MSKSELRAAMRKARKSYVAGLAKDARDQLEQALADRLWPLVRSSRCFAIYSPIGSEIDLRRLADRDDAPPMAYPAFINAESPMTFRSGPCVEACPVGGVQPQGPENEVSPDLVLVPLLAVDLKGNRLGQGGGHYDRALPALRDAGAQLIGVGWDMQRLHVALPADPWDVPLDGFASPSGLKRFR